MLIVIVENAGDSVINIPDESLILVDNIDTVKDIQYFCLMDLESLYNCGGEN